MESAGKLISELSRAAHIYFQSEFKQYSIGHAQLFTLLIISRNEGISQLEISKKLNLDKSSITSQLSILEKNEYILKKVDTKDARGYQIFLTSKSKKILKPIKKVLASWSETLLDGFTEDEKEAVFQYLIRMRDNVKIKIDNIKK